MIDLVKSAGISDNEFLVLLKNFNESCEIFIRYKKTKSRPDVGFSLAHEFNKTVTMDLESFRNGYILHLADHHLSYLNIGQPYLVLPKCFYGNGGEFNNKDFREMGEQLHINIRTTGAEPPWSNDIVEKHISVIGNMMEKVLPDVSCILEVALRWCLSAMHALLNSYGYSPNQLVLG